MGKAANLHFNKNGKRTRNISDLEYIRKNFFCKYLGAPEMGKGMIYGFGWKSGCFGLDPRKFNSGSSGATTWIHVDVREFHKTYLKDEFFTKEQKLVVGKKITEY